MTLKLSQLITASSLIIGFCSSPFSFADKTAKDKALSEQLFNANSEESNEKSIAASEVKTLAPNQTNLPHGLDWHAIDELTYEQKLYLKPGCAGRYIDPSIHQLNEQSSFISDRFLLENENSELKLSTDQQPLYIEADSSVVTGGNKAVLDGDVRIQQGQRSIRAQHILYDRDIDRVQLEGDVIIRQPGLLVLGEKATASTVKNEASFEQSQFVLHETHMRGQAESIKQVGRGKVVLKNGSMTSCPPGSEAWSLSGGELGVDQETGQGYGKNVRINIGSVPIFYIPYLSFPVGDARQSGFLFPSISSSEDGGIDIAAPYYWNIAENYDATITPRVITDRGFMLETEFRHLGLIDNKRIDTTLGLSYLPNDEGGSDDDIDALINSGVNEAIARPNQGRDRWMAQLFQQAGGNQGWWYKTDYSRVSDFDYLRDLGTSSLYVANTTFLDQRTQAGYVFEHWEVSALVQDYQVLLADIDSPYRKLPQIDANAYYQLSLPSIGEVETTFNHQYTHFDNKQSSNINGAAIVQGQRFTTDYRANKKLSNDSAYIKGEVGHKSLHYQLDNDPGLTLSERSINLSAAQLSVDMGIAFEQPAGQITQTLEPRLYYLYREHENQNALYDINSFGQSVNFDTSVRTFSYDQLYRDSRFSGSDRLDDANRLTIGVTSRWIDNNTGLDLASISLGQINHFTDRRIGLDSEIPITEDNSELALNTTVAIGPLADAYMSVIYDSSDETLQRLSAGMSVRSTDQGTILNVLYTYARQDAEVSQSEKVDQVDISLITQVSRQWALMGRINYDFFNRQELETFAGFEYDDCCYRLRLLARRWLDSNTANISSNEDLRFDQGIFFEISLKGLGGSGRSIEGILEDSIVGYKERDYVNLDDVNIQP